MAAVGGDILGVGPTFGTVAGDSTANLGRLEPDLVEALMTEDDPGTAGNGGSRAGQQQGGGANGMGGRYSEGDADVRGRVVPVVPEDADLALRPVAGSTPAAAAGAATGAGYAGYHGHPRGAAEGGLTGETTEQEYGPEGFDLLEPGDIAAGEEFEPASYSRSRSAGQAKMDPDPRLRPDPDPRRGLGLEDSSGTSHPVDKADFAMGTVAVPAFAGDAEAVRSMEYTDEPKYAGEVEVGVVGDEDLGELAGAAVAGSSGGSSSIGGSGDGLEAGAMLSDGRGAAVSAPGVDDVGRVAGGTGVEGSGPVLFQAVGEGQLQQAGIAAATAGQPGSATDARHLGAIFGQNPYGT